MTDEAEVWRKFVALARELELPVNDLLKFAVEPSNAGPLFIATYRNKKRDGDLPAVDVFNKTTNIEFIVSHETRIAVDNE